VRSALLKIAQVNPKIYTAIPIQGSGTVATEATIRTLFGRDSGTVINLLFEAFAAKRVVVLTSIYIFV